MQLTRSCIPGANLARPVSKVGTRPCRPVIMPMARQTGMKVQAGPVSNAPAYGEQQQYSQSAGNKMFTQYGIYKGKAALSVKIIPPTWSVLPNGNSLMSRDGVILLEFAPVGSGNNASGRGAPGERSYNWTEKSIISLNVTELGTILASEQELGQKGIDFYHDPNKGGEKSGQAFKSLKINGNPDGSIMFTLNAKDKSQPGKDSFISVPVTKGEFAVFKSLFNYAIPRLLGFDIVCEGGFAAN